MADSDTLWNSDVIVDSYSGSRLEYQKAIMEQYKLCVEMADRVSQRRALTNTFFLTLNSLVFTAVGILWNDRPVAAVGWLLLPLIAALGECLAWLYLVRSYRQLNKAKYQIIGWLEERLPASPYWRAEWTALGFGQDRSLYWPLTHIERWIPILFSSLYVSAFLAILLS